MKKIFAVLVTFGLLSCALSYSPDPALDGVWKYEYRSGDKKYDIKELTFKNNTLIRYLSKNDYYYIDSPENEVWCYVYRVSGSKIYFTPTDSQWVPTGNPEESYYYNISGDTLTVNMTDYKRQ